MLLRVVSLWWTTMHCLYWSLLMYYRQGESDHRQWKAVCTGPAANTSQVPRTQSAYLLTDDSDDRFARGSIQYCVAYTSGANMHLHFDSMCTWVLIDPLYLFRTASAVQKEQSWWYLYGTLHNKERHLCLVLSYASHSVDWTLPAAPIFLSRSKRNQSELGYMHVYSRWGLVHTSCVFC